MLWLGATGWKAGERTCCCWAVGRWAHTTSSHSPTLQRCSAPLPPHSTNCQNSSPKMLAWGSGCVGRKWSLTWWLYPLLHKLNIGVSFAVGGVLHSARDADVQVKASPTHYTWTSDSTTRASKGVGAGAPPPVSITASSYVYGNRATMAAPRWILPQGPGCTLCSFHSNMAAAHSCKRKRSR